jgi:uncharacterized protein with PQ loop repeat
MDMELPVIAGAASTIIFAMSTLPMLIKAAKTKDLSSYSLGNIMLSNIGNVIHSIYVFSLPMGPIWLLHSFYLITTALMLVWYLRFEFDMERQLSGLKRWVRGRQLILETGSTQVAKLAVHAIKLPQFITIAPAPVDKARGFQRAFKDLAG